MLRHTIDKHLKNILQSYSYGVSIWVVPRKSLGTINSLFILSILSLQDHFLICRAINFQLFLSIKTHGFSWSTWAGKHSLGKDETIWTQIQCSIQRGGGKKGQEWQLQKLQEAQFYRIIHSSMEAWIYAILQNLL